MVWLPKQKTETKKISLVILKVGSPYESKAVVLLEEAPVNIFLK